jgi:predicted Fe-Mo cluster-binding NifX family protein
MFIVLDDPLRHAGFLPMRLALGTDDKKTLRRELFGDSHYFCIAEVKAGKWKVLEYRDNPHADPAIADKPPLVLQFLGDCTAFLSRSLRKGAFVLFAKNGKIPLVTSHETIDDALSAIARRELHRFKRFDLVEDGFVPLKEVDIHLLSRARRTP